MFRAQRHALALVGCSDDGKRCVAEHRSGSADPGARNGHRHGELPDRPTRRPAWSYGGVARRRCICGSRGAAGTLRWRRCALFDVRVELLNNGTPVASGLQRCLRISALARRKSSVPWSALASRLRLEDGDVLALRCVGPRRHESERHHDARAKGAHSGLRLLLRLGDGCASRFGTKITPSPNVGRVSALHGIARRGRAGGRVRRASRTPAMPELEYRERLGRDRHLEPRCAGRLRRTSSFPRCATTRPRPRRRRSSSSACLSRLRPRLACATCREPAGLHHRGE